MSKFFSKTSWKFCGLLPVIVVMPLVFVFQPKFQLRIQTGLRPQRLNRCRPYTHSSIYFSSDEGQFCCIRTFACSLKCDPSLLIRTIPNKAGFTAKALAGPAPSLLHTLLVLSKYTSVRYYQGCQVVFSPGFLHIVWGYIYVAPVGTKLRLV